MTSTSPPPRTIDRVHGLALDGMTTARLCKLASLLDAGRHFEAVYLAGLYRRQRTGGEYVPARKANFNPNEARNRRGWWTKEVQGRSSGSPTIDVQYRGRFHDVVVDDLLKGLAEKGSTVLKNVTVLGINGVPAIPDGVSKPKGSSKPYFIEVKTGDDPTFTANQRQVYPLICMGGHATSLDQRISDLGLTPGVPFPPMDILLLYTQGPGERVYIDNYCRLIGLR